MRTILLSSMILMSFGAASIAEEKCKNPPPVFDCDDWRVSDGRLVAKHDLTAGLLGMTEGSYIGDHTMIGGLDYAEELKKQCGDSGGGDWTTKP